jgi:serine/threonine protein kinase
MQVDRNSIEYPPEVPAEAREFIEALVQKDPALRPKSHDLLKFRLFTQHLPKGSKPKKVQ